MPGGFPGVSGLGGGGGATPGGGGGGSFLPGLLELLAKSDISYQGSGGQSFSFSPQSGNRKEMIEKLMAILGSPRGVGSSAAQIVNVGGQDTGILPETALGGGSSFLDRPVNMSSFFR